MPVTSSLPPPWQPAASRPQLRVWRLEAHVFHYWATCRRVAETLRGIGLFVGHVQKQMIQPPTWHVGQHPEWLLQALPSCDNPGNWLEPTRPVARPTSHVRHCEGSNPDCKLVLRTVQRRVQGWPLSGPPRLFARNPQGK